MQALQQPYQAPLPVPQPLLEVQVGLRVEVPLLLLERGVQAPLLVLGV